MVIDVFSKYGWIVPLKDKKGESVAEAFKTILVSFRLDYEYEIDYEYDFSILVFRLHIITTHTNSIT